MTGKIKMPSKEDMTKLVGKKVTKVKYYPDFIFGFELHFDDRTVLKVVFSADSGFIELKKLESL